MLGSVYRVAQTAYHKIVGVIKQTDIEIWTSLKYTYGIHRWWSMFG